MPEMLILICSRTDLKFTCTFPFIPGLSFCQMASEVGLWAGHRPEVFLPVKES